jgi:hypothetical protein
MKSFEAMIKKLHICFLVTSILFCLSARSNENTDVINDLIIDSGINEQIIQFPKAMEYKIKQIYTLGQCDELALNIINSSIQKTINIERMRNIVLNDLQAQLTNDEIKKLNTWHKSALGKKIHLLELNSSSNEAYDEMKSEGLFLFANKQHLDFAKKIDFELRATEWGVNVDLQTTIAMLGALAQIQQKNITPNLIQFALELDEQKKLLNPQIEKSILTWYLYTFQSLNNKELQTYLDFLKHENTKNFHQIVLKSLSHAITVVIEDFIIAIETDSNNTIEK